MIKSFRYWGKSLSCFWGLHPAHYYTWKMVFHHQCSHFVRKHSNGHFKVEMDLGTIMFLQICVWSNDWQWACFCMRAPVKLDGWVSHADEGIFCYWFIFNLPILFYYVLNASSTQCILCYRGFLIISNYKIWKASSLYSLAPTYPESFMHGKLATIKLGNPILISSEVIC